MVRPLKETRTGIARELEEVQDIRWAEWQGMPEFRHKWLEDPYASLTVHFMDEAELQEFAKLVDQPLTKKTPSIWFKPDPDVEVSGKAHYITKEER